MAKHRQHGGPRKWRQEQVPVPPVPECWAISRDQADTCDPRVHAAVAMDALDRVVWVRWVLSCGTLESGTPVVRKSEKVSALPGLPSFPPPYKWGLRWVSVSTSLGIPLLVPLCGRLRVRKSTCQVVARRCWCGLAWSVRDALGFSRSVREWAVTNTRPRHLTGVGDSPGAFATLCDFGPYNPPKPQFTL